MRVRLIDDRVVYWWQNTNDGSTWTEYTVDETNDRFRTSIDADDLDGDGNVDIIVDSNADGEINWWSNVLGDGTTWKKYTFESLSADLNAVYADDFDNDGDADVLGVDDSNLYLLDNPNGSSTDWAVTTVSSTGGNDISAGDLNDDTYLDIVVTDDSGVYWWSNNSGDFSSSLAQEISTELISGIDIQDIDGDGNLDVVGADGDTNRVVWWQNNGDGTNWTENVVVENYLASDVHVEDMDDDGDLDILSTASTDSSSSAEQNNVTWWENTVDSSGGIEWIEHTLSNAYTRASKVDAEDLDNDGDLDVLAASTLGTIARWENGSNIKEGSSFSYNFGSTVSFTIADDSAELGVDYSLQDSAGNTLVADSSGTYTSDTLVIEAIDDFVYDSAEKSFTLALSEADGGQTYEHTIVNSNPAVSIADYTTTIYETPVDFGNTVALNGEDASISFDIDNVNAVAEVETEVTYEFWFKTTKDNTGLFSVAKNNGEATDRQIYLNNGNIAVPDNDNQTLATTGLNLADGQWHHVAHVIGSSVGGQKIYVDGKLTAEGAKDTSTFDDILLNARIGYAEDAESDYFEGEIDEVRLWNEVRTQEEIQENLYQSIEEKNDLIAYYSFGDDTTLGTTVTDVSENGYDGILSNGDGNNFSESFSFLGHVDLKLDNEVTNQLGVIVNYQIDSDSTATQDEDFYNSQTDFTTADSNPQTDSVFIPQGEDSARIYLTSLADEVAEGDESINLTILPDFNQAIELDGSNDYVSIADSNNIDFDTDDDFTIETWFKADSNQEDLTNSEKLYY